MGIYCWEKISQRISEKRGAVFQTLGSLGWSDYNCRISVSVVRKMLKTGVERKTTGKERFVWA